MRDTTQPPAVALGTISSINLQFISKNKDTMKILNGQWLKIAGLAGTSLILLTLSRAVVLGQTAPGLAIAPMGTNQYSIIITNNIGMADFDLQWTPVLASPDFPWTWAAIGTPGQTNFFLTVGNYPTAFFRTILDTNAIPLWEAADANNPGTGILKVTILNPANGATLN
jgi:hypothetical protein